MQCIFGPLSGVICEVSINLDRVSYIEMQRTFSSFRHQPKLIKLTQSTEPSFDLYKLKLECKAYQDQLD